MAFSDILNKQSAEVERPKPLPAGTYLCIVDGQFKQDNVGEKKTPVLDYTLKVLQPQADVDQSALADMGGFAGKTVRARYFITEDAVWRLKQFLVEHLGIDEGSKTLGELAAEAPGKQVMVTVRHRPSQDGSTLFAEIGQTARV